MSVTAAASSTSAATTSQAATASASTSQASEERFLKLLVAQLNNQDPLNPMENAELTSQLAQLSTVSGIEKMNQSLQLLIGQSSDAKLMQAASLVSRFVLVAGNELVTDGESSAVFVVDLPGSAESVKAVITDETGRTVRTIDMKTLPVGLHAYAWDGLDDAGNAVGAGMYRVNVKAANGAAPVQATSLVYSQVASVANNAGDVSLQLLTGRDVPLSEVRAVL